MYCAKNGGTDVLGLAHDIKNVLFHAAGFHDNCRSYFCSKPNEVNVLDLIKQNMDVYNAVMKVLIDLSLDADRLCHGLNTNIAENFMTTVAKFTMGKRENICGRGSYSLRVLFAVCLHNDGYAWAKDMMASFIGEDPPPAFISYASRRDKKIKLTNDYKSKPSFVRNITKKQVAETVYGAKAGKTSREIAAALPDTRRQIAVIMFSLKKSFTNIHYVKKSHFTYLILLKKTPEFCYTRAGGFNFGLTFFDIIQKPELTNSNRHLGRIVTTV